VLSTRHVSTCLNIHCDLREVIQYPEHDATREIARFSQVTQEDVLVGQISIAMDKIRPEGVEFLKALPKVFPFLNCSAEDAGNSV
jgi:hypothetical protein